MSLLFKLCIFITSILFYILFIHQDAGKFCLTYEASMTRLFREGRTETVRSCTVESAEFCKAVESGDKSDADLKKLLQAACDRHQNGYRDAMTGHGKDNYGQHIAMNIISKSYI